MTIQKIAIALSGGVDSAVAARLLQKQGYDLTALYLKLFSGDVGENQARVVAEFLKMPFYVIDARTEFKKRIINYFLDEYKNGRTPNPCVKCNRDIKFGILYRKAKALGFSKLATGHYIKSKIKNQKSKIYMAKDKTKDQSYFLYNLTQEILANVEFPLGNWTKEQVKKMAEKWQIPVIERESQNLCFVLDTKLHEIEHETTRKIDHNGFLKAHLKMKQGDIVDITGKKIGKHNGLPMYTLGQRRAVEIGGTGPYYVVRKDRKTNRLIVSTDRDDPLLYSNELTATDVNWIGGNEHRFPLKIQARIRYRQEAQEAIIEKGGTKKIYIVKFKEPQRAITTGQSVVFYKGKEMMGGGIIG